MFVESISKGNMEKGSGGVCFPKSCMSGMFVRNPPEKSRSKGEGGVDLRGREIHFAMWTNTFCRYVCPRSTWEVWVKGSGRGRVAGRTNRVGFSQVNTCEKSCVYLWKAEYTAFQCIFPRSCFWNLLTELREHKQNRLFTGEYMFLLKKGKHKDFHFYLPENPCIFL